MHSDAPAAQVKQVASELQFDNPIVLYGFKLSGHSHRAELMLRVLDLPYSFHKVDLIKRKQKAPAYLSLNPFGTVPTIDDNGTVVTDSTAILVYLATKYDPSRIWLPADPAMAARVQGWLSIAQTLLFNGPHTARLIKAFGAPLDYQRAKGISERLLDVLEAHLRARAFLIGSTAPTIADIALCYVAQAPEGDIPLLPYPGVRAWLDRMAALPGFEAMPPVRAGLAA